MTENRKYTILLNYATRQLVYRVSKYEISSEDKTITFFDEVTTRQITAPLDICLIQEVQ